MVLGHSPAGHYRAIFGMGDLSGGDVRGEMSGGWGMSKGGGVGVGGGVRINGLGNVLESFCIHYMCEVKL